MPGLVVGNNPERSDGAGQDPLSHFQFARSKLEPILTRFDLDITGVHESAEPGNGTAPIVVIFTSKHNQEGDKAIHRALSALAT